MQPSVTLVTLLAATGVIATPVAAPEPVALAGVDNIHSSANDLQKRANLDVIVFRGFNQNGPSSTISVPDGECFNLDPVLAAEASSIRRTVAMGCVLFNRRNCGGGFSQSFSKSAGDIDRFAVRINDRLESIRCST